MKKLSLQINAPIYVLIIGFLAMPVITSLSSGYPWTIACYNCLLCRQSCPFGIDPHGFISAAMTNDPALYIGAANIRIRVGEALDLDPQMVLRVDGREITAADAVSQGVERNREVRTSRMKARDAARYCPLCGNCEKKCPINLPSLKIIEDLRDDGQFNG
jgi:L-lactate utilization protein LutB